MGANTRAGGSKRNQLCIGWRSLLPNQSFRSASSRVSPSRLFSHPMLTGRQRTTPDGSPNKKKSKLAFLDLCVSDSGEDETSVSTKPPVKPAGPKAADDHDLPCNTCVLSAEAENLRALPGEEARLSSGPPEARARAADLSLLSRISSGNPVFVESRQQAFKEIRARCERRALVVDVNFRGGMVTDFDAIEEEWYKKQDDADAIASAQSVLRALDEVRSEIRGLRSSVQAEIRSLRTEIQALSMLMNDALNHHLVPAPGPKVFWRQGP
ncbi:hypothetical protein EJ07DRAFT_152069 [Lizonia empirigonia]|nr:hypothetical protein EJ07DRAFT_152069 [Lizonia empirigonia]